jgi:hypothetical protein
VRNVYAIKDGVKVLRLRLRPEAVIRPDLPPVCRGRPDLPSLAWILCRHEVRVMPRRFPLLGGLLLGLGLILSGRSAPAVIPTAFPLQSVLKGKGAYPHIFMVKVEKFLPDKPAMMLKVEENLKGKMPFEKLPVNLTADDEGKKAGDTEKMLKRLAGGVPLVVFLRHREKDYTAVGYSNGTWFQMLGFPEKEGNPPLVRWSFQHIEPILRQTYKGTTAELRQTIVDALAGKKDPPKVDLKEKPGIGPELKKEEKPKAGTRPAAIRDQEPRRDGLVRFAVDDRSSPDSLFIISVRPKSRPTPA